VRILGSQGGKEEKAGGTSSTWRVVSSKQLCLHCSWRHSAPPSLCLPIPTLYCSYLHLFYLSPYGQYYVLLNVILINLCLSVPDVSFLSPFLCLSCFLVFFSHYYNTLTEMITNADCPSSKA